MRKKISSAIGPKCFAASKAYTNTNRGEYKYLN